MNPDPIYSNGLSEPQRQYIIRDEREPVTIGYVRMSPAHPDQATPVESIREYARYYGWIVFGIVFEKISGMTSWHNRTGLKWLSESLKTGDRLIVEDLSQLGRNVHNVVSLLVTMHSRGVAVCDIRNKWRIDNTISPQMMAMFHAISGQIDREHASMRTQEGLAARKSKGLRLGRKKGIAPSKLDSYKDEIIDLLKSGSTKAYIMKKYNTSKTNLYHWLKRNQLDDISPVYDGSPKK